MGVRIIKALLLWGSLLGPPIVWMLVVILAILAYTSYQAGIFEDWGVLSKQ